MLVSKSTCCLSRLPWYTLALDVYRKVSKVANLDWSTIRIVHLILFLQIFKKLKNSLKIFLEWVFVLCFTWNKNHHVVKLSNNYRKLKSGSPFTPDCLYQQYCNCGDHEEQGPT